MRMALLVLAAGALLSSAAQAKDGPNEPTAGKDQPAVKMLYVCSEDEAAWRPFSRDLGVPEFVTAAQVRASSGKAWSAPKCITSSELRRLTGGTQMGRLTRTGLTPPK